MHARTDARAHVRMYACTRTHAHTHTHTRALTLTFTHTCAHTFTHGARARAHALMHIHTHVRAHTHKHTLSLTHTHIHTHTSARARASNMRAHHTLTAQNPKVNPRSLLIHMAEKRQHWLPCPRLSKEPTIRHVKTPPRLQTLHLTPTVLQSLSIY